MINVKEAVARAAQFIKDMYEENKVENVLLEEVEWSDDFNCWEVTLSLLRPKPNLDATDLFAPKEYERVYKKLRVQTETGEVLSMNRAD